MVIDACRATVAEVGAECTFLIFCPLSTPYGLWTGAWEAAGDYVGLLERFEKITAAGEDRFDEMSDKVSLTAPAKEQERPLHPDITEREILQRGAKP